MIERLAKEALRRRAEQAEERKGRSGALSGSGLEIGTQRYHDPSIWGPDYEIRSAPPGKTNSAAHIAEMKQVPLPADRRFLKIAEFVSEDKLPPEPEDPPN